MQFRFGIRSLIFAIAVLAILFACYRKISIHPPITSYTTGGDREQGYSWCVLMSSGQVAAVLVDFDDRAGNGPSFFKLKMAAPNDVVVEGVPWQFGSRRVLYIRVRDGEIKRRALTDAEYVKYFEPNGFLKAPIEFCEAMRLQMEQAAGLGS